MLAHLRDAYDGVVATITLGHQMLGKGARTFYIVQIS